MLLRSFKLLQAVIVYPTGTFGSRLSLLVHAAIEGANHPCDGHLMTPLKKLLLTKFSSIFKQNMALSVQVTDRIGTIGPLPPLGVAFSHETSRLSSPPVSLLKLFISEVLRGILSHLLFVILQPLENTPHPAPCTNSYPGATPVTSAF